MGEIETLGKKNRFRTNRGVIPASNSPQCNKIRLSIEVGWKEAEKRIAYIARKNEEKRKAYHPGTGWLLRACPSGHSMAVVWLKDSGQAVTCLDCKYWGKQSSLPKPKLKPAATWEEKESEREKEKERETSASRKRENLIGLQATLPRALPSRFLATILLYPHWHLLGNPPKNS